MGGVLIFLGLVVLFGFALLCRRPSNRFPKLAMKTNGGSTSEPILAPVRELAAEMAPISALLRDGRDLEAVDALSKSLREHAIRRSPAGTLAVIADPLISTLRKLGRDEEAAQISAFVATASEGGGVASSNGPRTESLFHKALVGESNVVTIRTLELVDALQGSSRPFTSAYLRRILWMVVLFVIALYLVGFIIHEAQPRAGAFRPDEGLGLVIVGALAIVSWQIYVARTTRYELVNGAIIYRQGGFSRAAETLELYRVHDVAVKRSLINRLSGDCSLVLTFEKREKPVWFRGWVKWNEADMLAMTLRDVSRAIRTNPNIKGILT